MPYDRFLIAPFNSGLETDLRPFLIPEDAFAQLNNAYVWRGRVRKRFGSTYIGHTQQSSRLRINIGTSNMTTGNFSGTAPGVRKAGQLISIGNYCYTVVSNTAGPQNMKRNDGVANTATFDVSNGNVVINASPALGAVVWFYPSLPVMGLTNFEEGAINNQPSFGFDTEFAYIYAGSGWTRSTAGTAPVFTGSDSQFFWTANWRGTSPGTTVLFVTNFNQADAIWYYSTAVGWTQAVTTNAFYFNPNGGAPRTGPFVVTCRLIAAFKNRLLLFDTYESDNAMSPTVTQYKNRVRWCHNGSPFAQNAWYEPNKFDNSGTTGLDTGDGGNFLDATTEEEIVSCEFIKDRLIVYFERSTWELAYTGNAVQPFVWQKLNTELGSEATFSTVPFDKEILTIGNTGVHSCNGSNVERIDNKIPDQVFEIQDKASGVARVAGVRDYFSEMVYWTFPSDQETSLQKFPDRVLVYNYKNGAWAFNNDCITCFGYFEQQTGLTWENSTTTWEQSNFSWNSGTIQAQFRQVLAGNQQGYTFVINSDVSVNAPVMQITDITFNASSDTCTITSLDHTLAVGQYVKLVDVNGVTMSGFGIYPVVSIDASSPDIFTIGNVTFFTGTYTGGGTIARASNISIVSKQWNPYLNRGQNFYLAKIDFGVQKTVSGQVTVDYFPSASDLSMLEEATATKAIQGTGELETSPYDPRYYPLERSQERLWHPVYFQVEGECIQIAVYMNESQMVVPSISESDFQLEGMVLHTQKISTRLE